MIKDRVQYIKDRPAAVQYRVVLSCNIASQPTMAHKTCVVLALVCFAQMSLANEPAPTAPTFQELIDKAKAALTDMSNHVNQMLGLPEQANSEQILNTMKDETNKLTEKVRAFVETLQKELEKDGTLRGVVNQVTSNLNSTLAELTQNAPDANQLQEKFAKAVQVVIDESKKVSEVLKKEGGEAHENLKSLVSQTLNQTSVLANEFQEKIHKIVTEKSGDHKH